MAVATTTRTLGNNRHNNGSNGQNHKGNSHGLTPGSNGPGGNGPGGNGPGGNGPSQFAGGGGLNNNPLGNFDPTGLGGGGDFGNGGNGFNAVGGGGGSFSSASSSFSSAGSGPIDEDQPFALSPGSAGGFANNGTSPGSGGSGGGGSGGGGSGGGGSGGGGSGGGGSGGGGQAAAPAASIPARPPTRATTQGSDDGIRPAVNFDVASGDADPDDAPILPASQRMFDRRFLLLQNRTGQPIKIYLRYRAFSNRGQWEWVPGAQGDLIYSLNPGEERYIGNKNFRILADRVVIWARGDSGELYETYRFKELVLGRANERDANGDLAYRGSRFGTFTYRFK